MSKLICHIIGNRPHFMKLAPVFHQFAKQDVNQYILHTGQHYDRFMSDDFLTEFDLPKPDINLGITNSNQAMFIGDALSQIANVLAELSPSVIIVYGDTNSTLAGAIAGAKQNIVTVHVEAGLREGNLSIPEEVNKRATDAICDILFVPSQKAFDQVKSEQVLGEVDFVGDVTYDLLLNMMPKIEQRAHSLLYNLGIQKDEPYYLATCHRAANTDNKENLEQILLALSSLEFSVIFLIHPRTAKAITSYKLDHYLNAKNIITEGPASYIDTQVLLSQCKLCITDSGGLIKEAYYHQKRAVIIDKQTEWIELLEANGHILAGPNQARIIDGVNSEAKFSIGRNIYGDGTAAKKIVSKLLRI